ncbi:hypothetical protein BJ508DRAFT_13024 [Ascobolus immersus RN42]|uniref:Uncharacterized protein n=1 Tax=Ascobolus immersus RN42 TaxID=1160509 RepID=A0A3N4IHJ7_ASCIM|nr:hypothetical protein BJ508DRAFT_13024 [Ascobolus immersus RN42]
MHLLHLFFFACFDKGGDVIPHIRCGLLFLLSLFIIVCYGVWCSGKWGILFFIFVFVYLGGFAYLGSALTFTCYRHGFCSFIKISFYSPRLFKLQYGESKFTFSMALMSSSHRVDRVHPLHPVVREKHRVALNVDTVSETLARNASS